jgi:hypothetical protein
MNVRNFGGLNGPRVSKSSIRDYALNRDRKGLKKKCSFLSLIHPKKFSIDILAIGFFTVMLIKISKLQVVNLNRKNAKHIRSLESNFQEEEFGDVSVKHS